MNFLVSGVCGLASGIFLRSFFIFGFEPIVFAVLLAFLFAGALFLNYRVVYVCGALFCLFAALGMFRTLLADTAPPKTFAAMLDSRISYSGLVVKDPDLRDNSERITVRVKSGNETTDILAIVPRTTITHVGDQVRVYGTLSRPKAFVDTAGRIFNYEKYLQREGIYFLLDFAYLRVDQTAPWYSPRALLARAKHSFIDGLGRVLPEPHASLAAGVVIGGKSGLGSTLQNAFVRSGLAQIIVLSGYNVMVVADWLMALFVALSVSKKWSAIAGALAIFGFVGIAGTSATAVRAMIMALIALFARATGRSYAASRALLLAVGLMLVWNPLYLAFDPGFGLSVVATAGLIWIAPLIEKVLSFTKAPVLLKERFQTTVPFWKNAIATTLAAQIAVLPLLLYDTGNLSLVSIPANLIAMPMIPLSMALSAFAGIVGMLFGSGVHIIAIVCALPAYLTNEFLLWVAQKSASLPFASITIPAFPISLTFGAYGMLIYAIAARKRFSAMLQLKFSKKASI